MKTAFCCAAVVAMAWVAALPAPTPALASAAHCRPGMHGCEAPDSREPSRAEVRHHPCGWVETCAVPCGSESAACCHGEWDCPSPEANVPHC